MGLHDEIRQQPAILAQLVEAQKANVQAIAREIQAQQIQYVFIAARGTSDNAGRYAKYLLGARNGLPVALATPSLFSLYERPPNLQDALVIGISQSGQSPDIVGVLAEAAKQGCLTLAITNSPHSPLAQVADFVLDIEAGVETAVAATKTYTTQLMSIAMLSCALADEGWETLAQVGDWVQSVLQRDDAIRQIAERYRFMQQCVVLGRGFNYATAFEWSLKLKELTYTIAEPYSSADFRHGPIAMVGQGFPVLAVAPTGAVFADMLDLLERLRQQERAEILVISDHDDALSLADAAIPLPFGMPEWVTPLVSIVPAQLFSYHLTRIKKLNTEAPRGLNKVTETL